MVELAVVALIAGLVGYLSGKTRGGSDMLREYFDPFFAEGYYAGWLTRHAGAELEDTRVHPDQLSRLVPTLRDSGQELAHWMQHGDHLPFEEYRAQQVAKLNRELQDEKQSKAGGPPSQAESKGRGPLNLDPQFFVTTKWENGFTWTLASRLGEMLHIAEEMFGPRDMQFTILGVDFKEGIPQTWYPGSRRTSLSSLASAQPWKCPVPASN
jgi:hypothetical protein